jgi:hypothetical protein
MNPSGLFIYSMSPNNEQNVSSNGGYQLVSFPREIQAIGAKTLPKISEIYRSDIMMFWASVACYKRPYSYFLTRYRSR